MKLTIAALSLFIGLTSCLAQSKVEIRPETKKTSTLRFDVGFDAGFLTHFYVTPGSAIGGDLRLQNKFSNKISWIASAGYTNLRAHSSTVSDLLAIKAGAKFFMTPTFYLAGEIGLGEYLNGGELLIYTPSAGFQLGKKWDLAVKHETYSNLSYAFSQIGMRVGYKLSK